MKKSRILIPALGVLVLSTAASITGTVAWFTANNKVAVDGMVVKTKVSSNIQIAPEVVSDAKNGNNEVAYRDSLTQARTALLEPVSTVNGVNFFYTNSALGSGDATEDDYETYSEATNRYGTTFATTAARDADEGEKVAGDLCFCTDPGKYYKYSGTAWEEYDINKPYYDLAFNTAYGLAHTSVDTTGFGYIDYSFYLKATNASAAAKDLIMTRCNMTYNGGALDASDKAWRVAMFVQSSAKETAMTTALSSATTILTLAGAANFTTGKAVNSASTLDDVTYGTAATVHASIAANATIYDKVTVRLWLEGEDTSCNNSTYALLTANSWSLDLMFEFSGGARSAVTAISNNADPIA